MIQIRLVGDMPKKKAKEKKKGCLHGLILRKEESVLYVSFGSMNKFFSTQLVEIAHMHFKILAMISSGWLGKLMKGLLGFFWKNLRRECKKAARVT